MSYSEPMFLISVVSKRLGIHPQTLRQYEREGLIEPGRTGGKVRMYSQRDVDKIKLILRFTRDLGVNLAGVGVILQLKNQLEIYEQMLANLEPSFRPAKMLLSEDGADGGDDSSGADGGDDSSGEEGADGGDFGVVKGALIHRLSSEMTVYKDD